MTQPDNQVPRSRRVYCNRTLNLRSIRAIGYDMDYTLVHYRVAAWEDRAYEHVRSILVASGWPLEDLRFEPDRVIRGLIIDTELGNIVKANRFGYIVGACHGTRPLEYDKRKTAYGRTLVELADPRWVFLNTLFTLSESWLYAQVVDLLDAGRLHQIHGYGDLFRRLHAAVDEAHVEGTLKQQILSDPGKVIEPDPDAALSLLDQREAGKRLLMITNAEWPYVRPIMEYAFDEFLPAGVRWQELFELVVVQARKPEFFSRRQPLFLVTNDDGDLRPAPLGFRKPGVYLGGDAAQVESYLGLSGDDILFVGDHVWADVKVSKSLLRWRTALILRELEEEIETLTGFREHEATLVRLMGKKEDLEAQLYRARLDLQRLELKYGPTPTRSRRSLRDQIHRLETKLAALDDEIAPLAREASQLGNPTWGPLLRAGSDKSLLARQLEGSADVYTSRIGNFLHATPFAFLRAPRGTLPHDPLP